MRIIKKIIAGTIQPVIAKKLQRTTYYKWKDITLRIPPGVFHPKYFFSTKYLLNYALQLQIENKSVFELGAGNGLLSIACAKKNAMVTASDISTKAIEALQENAKTNHVNIKIIHSDLFDAVDAQIFDFIFINPPYYAKTPRNEMEKAWYCGEDFEYFEKLFRQLNAYINQSSKVIMVLSEDCNLEKIFSIARGNNFNFTEIHTKKFYWERNYLFQITTS